MVASDRRRVEHYQRTPEGWVLRVYGEGEVTLAMGARLSLDAVYRLVDL